MSQQHFSNRILAGTLTFLGLGAVWVAILSQLPSAHELLAVESPQLSAQAVASAQAPQPVLDLSIPGVPATPSVTAPSAALPDSLPVADPHAAQVARLRCEAEVEQLCPDASDGSGRSHCLEKRARQLSVACQQQMRERLVRWKEERGRLFLACHADLKRFCSDARAGGVQAFQCLKQHAQELSDGCYGMLPKGTLHYKQ